MSQDGSAELRGYGSITKGSRGWGEALNKNVQTRLRRIEGQVQGLQRMLETGRECEEMLTQVMAVRSSIDQVGILLMEGHIEPACSRPAGRYRLATSAWP